MSDVFCRRLRMLDVKTKEDLGSALKAASACAIVRSAFELAPAQRAALQQRSMKPSPRKFVSGSNSA